jgi:hypothetical protein
MVSKQAFMRTDRVRIVQRCLRAEERALPVYNGGIIRLADPIRINGM